MVVDSLIEHNTEDPSRGKMATPNNTVHKYTCTPLFSVPVSSDA